MSNALDMTESEWNGVNILPHPRSAELRPHAAEWSAVEYFKLASIIHRIVRAEMEKETKEREELARRISDIEKEFPELMELIMLEMAERNQRTHYARMRHPSPGTDVTDGVSRPTTIFYVLGLVCSVGFASLLALSAAGIHLIHPFLSLLGMVGGLGWVTTAWRDTLSRRPKKYAIGKAQPQDKGLETIRTR